MTSFKPIKIKQNTAAPCPRWGHSICALEDSLLLFGGYQNSKYYKDLWRFNLQTLEWSQIEQKGQVPPPCSNCTMNLNNDKSKMVIMGGGTINKQKLNLAYQLDLTTYNWKKINYNENEPQPWQRSYHCAQIIDKYLVVFGGQFFHDFDDLWVFNMQTNHWKQIQFNNESKKPKGRKFASSFKYQNKMYVVGGCQNKYECIDDIFYVDFQKFIETQNTEDLQWKEFNISNKDAIKRWGHATCVKDQKAYVFGGRYSNKDIQNFVQIDLVTGKCSQIKLSGSVKGRRKPGLCLRNNTIFCFSGFDGSYLKDFLYLDLTKRPELSKFKQDNEMLQNLKKQFSYYQPEELDYKFDKNVINMELFQMEQCLKYIDEHIKIPIMIDNYRGRRACGTQFAKKSKYFQNFMKRQQQSAIIYKPDGISLEEYDILVQTFVLYMSFSKIMFNSLSFAQQLNIIPYLIELADYYCIDQLKLIAQNYALQLFQQKVRSSRAEVKDVLDSAFYLNKLDSRYGEWACYFGLKSLASKLSLDMLQQLYQLSNNWQQETQRQWTKTIIKKYNFELKESIQQKQRCESQNTKPQPYCPSSNKMQQRQTTIKKANKYF